VPISWERDGPIGVAVIDRPERRNALSADLCGVLRGHLEQNADLRAVVISGSGDKAFCAGADLGRRATEVGGLEHGGGDSFRPAFESLLDTIVSCPAPVIAAVNGAALGAGMQLAVACDLRVVAPHATFGIPAARLGVLLSGPNIGRLATLVGQAAARDLLFTARLLDADDARSVGLVQRSAPNALVAARALAGEIAELAPLTIAGHKRALTLVAEAQSLSPDMRTEIGQLEENAFASSDLQEGLAAFGAKRRPRFEGR
jgi:enoyl-CoA hydratase/carnithine racemase